MLITKDKLTEASDGLRGIAHPLRLAILCHLAGGPLNVSELMRVTGAAQALLSQHLAKLRLLNIVSCERRGQHCYYRLADPGYMRIIAAIKSVYCPDDSGAAEEQRR